MASNKVPNKQFKTIRPLSRLAYLLQSKRIQAGGIGAVWFVALLFSFVTPLVLTDKALAAPTSWRWLNGQTIIDNEGKSYLDDSPDDNTHLYFRQVAALNCPNSPEINGHDTKVDAIDIRGWTTSGPQPAGGHDYWTVAAGNVNNTNCSISMTNGNISISDAQFSVATYNWIDQGTIRHFKMSVGTGDIGFVNRQGAATFKLITGGVYQEQTSSACKSSIKPSADHTTASITYSADDPNGSGCTTQTYNNIPLALVSNYAIGAGTGGGGGGNGAGGTGNAKPPESCETQSAESVIGWLMCGFIHLLDNTISFLDTKVQELLVIDMGKLNDPKFVQTWGVIRNISLLILVPVMLLMVLGTAAEIGPFSAYTFRKSFPRFFIAVIWIVASLPIVKFLIQISNLATTGIEGLVTSAFGDPNQVITLQSLVTQGQAAGATTGIFAAVIVASAAGALTLGMAFSFALVAAVTMFIAYIALEIRVLLVLGIALGSSLPILAWIFEGNDGMWKAPKNTLQTLLLLGPVLAGFIAFGKVLASLAGQWYLAAAIYIAVYALLLTLMQRFGGLMGTIMSGINDKSRGFFDGQRKMRQNSQQRAMNKFKVGERGPAWNRKLGFTTGAFLEAEKKGKFIGSAVRNVGRNQKTGYYAEAVAQQTKLNQMRYAQTERAKATQEDDGHMLQALTYKTASEARARMGADWGTNSDQIERSIAAVNATGGFSEARQNYAARRLAATGTGYDDIEQMQRTVARVAGNNRSKAADLLGEMNAVTKGVGRHDLAAGFGNQMTMYEQIQQRGGYEEIARTNSSLLTPNEVREAHLQAAKDIDAVTLLRDKKKGVENMSDALGQSFNVAQQAVIDARATISNPASTPDQVTAATAQLNHNRDEMARLTGYIAKLEQSGAYASLTNVEEAGARAITPTSGAGSSAATTTVAGLTVQVPDTGREAVRAQASPVQVQVNPVTGRSETFNLKTVNASGQLVDVIDPVTGRPIPAPNPGLDPRAQELLRRHGPTSGGINPNDPNY